MENLDSSIIFIKHDGLLTQNEIQSMTELLENDMLCNNINIGLLTNIVTIFIELSQNIMKYSKNENANCRLIDPSGVILVSRDDDCNYSIQSQNIISLEDKEKMEPKLIEINSLDKDEIKARYKELRKSGKNTHAKGGGIGFYEIAKRCDKIQYKFMKLNEDKFIFHLKVMAKNKTLNI